MNPKGLRIAGMLVISVAVFVGIFQGYKLARGQAALWAAASQVPAPTVGNPASQLSEAEQTRIRTLQVQVRRHQLLLGGTVILAIGGVGILVLGRSRPEDGQADRTGKLRKAA